MHSKCSKLISFGQLQKKVCFMQNTILRNNMGMKVLPFMNMNSNDVNVSVQKFGYGLFNKNGPLTLRGNKTNASFEQWVGILPMPKYYSWFILMISPIVHLFINSIYFLMILINFIPIVIYSILSKMLIEKWNKPMPLCQQTISQCC